MVQNAKREYLILHTHLSSGNRRENLQSYINIGQEGADSPKIPPEFAVHVPFEAKINDWSRDSSTRDTRGYHFPSRKRPRGRTWKFLQSQGVEVLIWVY